VRIFPEFVQDGSEGGVPRICGEELRAGGDGPLEFGEERLGFRLFEDLDELEERELAFGGEVLEGHIGTEAELGDDGLAEGLDEGEGDGLLGGVAHAGKIQREGVGEKRKVWSLFGRVTAGCQSGGQMAKSDRQRRWTPRQARGTRRHREKRRGGKEGRNWVQEERGEGASDRLVRLRSY